MKLFWMNGMNEFWELMQFRILFGNDSDMSNR